MSMTTPVPQNTALLRPDVPTTIEHLGASKGFDALCWSMAFLVSAATFPLLVGLWGWVL